MTDDMHDATMPRATLSCRSRPRPSCPPDAFTTRRSLLLITWNESDDSPGNQVATLAIANKVPNGFQSQVPHTHYSLLRTIEIAWDLAPLTANAGAATPMTDFFPAG